MPGPEKTASFRRYELPDLGAALAQANNTACALLRRMREKSGQPRGHVQIEDEAHRPLARILLADVARQIR